MGDTGKLQLYELDDESKMQLLKTHSHTSNGLAMEPGTREEKQLKKTQTLRQGKSHPSKTCHAPPGWPGRGRKGSRTCQAVEGSADSLTRLKPTIKNLPRTAGVARGGRKGSRTYRISPVWRGEAGKVLGQTNHRKGTTARRMDSKPI